MTTLLITGGRVIDPSQNIDSVIDLWIIDDRIATVRPRPDLRPDRTIDATGRIVTPGWIDMHVHLREPGREEDETIASGAAAAVAGGVTSVACMPNTEPPIDNQAAVEFVYLQAMRAGMANVFPIGCVTKGRKGEELAEIGQMVTGGAVAFTDDGSPVSSAEMMRRALEYSTMFDKAILSHCEDLDLTGGGVMHEGLVSLDLGLRGMPALAEELHVFRDIQLAKLTGGRVHILHVSTAGSVELIRRAKHDGLRVTGEACPHHFLLTDESLRTFDANYKMAPPLRSKADADAVCAGLIDGTLDVIATDHAPHAPEKKAREFDQCPNGILGVETLLPLCVTHLIETGHLTWPQLIEKVTGNPAQILSIDRGTLKPGAPADVTIIDSKVEWTIDANHFQSKSRNCPFDGWKVRGRAETVIVAGTVKKPSRNHSGKAGET
jgi:dihydroorotase